MKAGTYREASLSLTRELGLKEQMGSVLIHLWLPYIAQIQLGVAFDANREAEAVWREIREPAEAGRDL